MKAILGVGLPLVASFLVLAHPRTSRTDHGYPRAAGVGFFFGPNEYVRQAAKRRQKKSKRAGEPPWI